MRKQKEANNAKLIVENCLDKINFNLSLKFKIRFKGLSFFIC